ncbi:MAG: hypothetical protein AAF085_12110 [Planctomycetota bacterium]
MAQSTSTKTKPDNQTKKRFKLTAPFKTEQGAVWPKGLEIECTEAEIKSRKIQAKPID